jgi:hypothetical protein
MHTLTLDDNERRLLIELLGARIKEVSHEIHQCDNRAYRDGLEKTKGTFEQLVKRVQCGSG